MISQTPGSINTNQGFSAGQPAMKERIRRRLFVLLLMTVFSETLFALMRSNFMALPLFPTRHKPNSFLINNLFQ
jgi:hypothetical protein